MKKFLAAILCLCVLLGTCVMGVSAADKVYALTLGVHKYSVNNTPSDGSGVASVSYTRHKDGSTGNANHLYDVTPGEVFTVETKLKEGQEGYYTFVAWLDENGVIVGETQKMEVTMDSSKTLIAAYAEVSNRYIASYSIIDGDGKISASSNRVNFQGEDCISVLEGADVTFKFTPAKENYAVRMELNGQRVSIVAYSVRTLVDAVKGGQIKDAFNAIVNFVKYCMGKEATYTVKNVHDDVDFAVKFVKTAF